MSETNHSSPDPTESQKAESTVDGDANAISKANTPIQSGRLLIGWAVCLIVCFTIVPLLPVQSIQHLSIEWGFWLIVFEAAGSCGLLLFLRTPEKKYRPMAWLSHLAVMTIAGLLIFHVYEMLLIRTSQMILRIVVIAAWGLAVLGFPFILRWLFKRMRKQFVAAPRFAKPWLLATLSVCLLEPFFSTYEQTQHRLAFRSDWPSKSSDRIHIVTLGASTMLGHPYQPKYGIPNVVEWQLQRTFPDQNISVQNLAVGGINFRQAVQQLAKSSHRPDLVILYSGHNDFYHDLDELSRHAQSLTPQLDRVMFHSPSFRILDEVLASRSAIREFHQGGAAFIDRKVCRGTDWQRRLDRFRDQIQQFVQHCRSNSIKLLVFVPAAAESCFDPNRSTLNVELSKSKQAALRKQYDQGIALERQEMWREASEVYQPLVNKYPEFAEFHFRLGLCLLNLDSFEQAQRHFENAKDLDGHPIRMVRDYQDVVRETANRFRLPLIESADILREATPNGILDSSMFHDNVHPTMPAFYLLGSHAASIIATESLIKGLDATELADATFQESVNDLGITDVDRAKALSRTADGLRYMTRWRFEETLRIEMAEELERQADLLSKRRETDSDALLKSNDSED